MSANDTSADRFARFEESFLNSSRIVTRNITQLSGTRGRVNAINSISVDIEFELDDADSYVVAMESEFRSMPSAEKKSIQQKVRVCLIVRTLRMNIFLIPSFVLSRFLCGERKSPQEMRKWEWDRRTSVRWIEKVTNR